MLEFELVIVEICPVLVLYQALPFTHIFSLIASMVINHDLMDIISSLRMRSINTRSDTISRTIYIAHGRR